jgi:hypothetical protein
LVYPVGAQDGGLRDSLTGAPDAGSNGPIELQPLLWDRFPALLTIPELIAIYPRQSQLNALTPQLPTALSPLSKGLLLKGVDSGQPTDTGLVKLHDLASGSALFVQSLDLAQLFSQGLSDQLQVYCDSAHCALLASATARLKV